VSPDTRFVIELALLIGRAGRHGDQQFFDVFASRPIEWIDLIADPDPCPACHRARTRNKGVTGSGSAL